MASVGGYEKEAKEFAKKYLAHAGNLIQTCDLYTSSRCELLTLVRKLKRQIFWMIKEKLIISDYNLKNLLPVLRDTLEGVKVNETEMGNSESTNTFKIGGKIGVKFFSVVDVGVGAEYRKQEMASMEAVTKQAIDIPQLEDVLKNSKVDMTNNFMKQVKEANEILCVVVALYKVTGSARISEHVKKEASARAGVDVDGVQIGPEGSCISEKQHKFENTSHSIIYEIREMRIHQDGSFELMMPGMNGGFEGEKAKEEKVKDEKVKTTSERSSERPNRTKSVLEKVKEKVIRIARGLAKLVCSLFKCCCKKKDNEGSSKMLQDVNRQNQNNQIGPANL